MKLAQLLKQFLYQHKKLDLPRIGTLFLKESTLQYPENHKHHDENLLELNFEYDPSTVADSELIAFISANTGKMKALASSDLDSFIEISIQFLNIGKVFKLEGIGTLIKTQQNIYAFTADKFITGKTLESAKKDSKNNDFEEESFSNFDTVNIEKNRSVFSIRKILFILLTLFGIGIIVWGIFYLNNLRGKEKTEQSIKTNKTSIVPILDDSTIKQPGLTDSVQENKNILGANNYKFVLEVAEKQRAFGRYAQLKSYNWNIKMETKDSILFKLFVIISSSPNDTARLKDSMNLLSGNKVSIEK